MAPAQIPVFLSQKPPVWERVRPPQAAALVQRDFSAAFLVHLAGVEGRRDLLHELCRRVRLQRREPLLTC